MFKKLCLVLMVMIFLTSCAQAQEPNLFATSVSLQATTVGKLVEKIDRMNAPASAEEIAAAVVKVLPTQIPIAPVVEKPAEPIKPIEKVQPIIVSTGKCDPLAVTDLSSREDAVVNGTKVTIQVRDLTQGCERPLWYNETGIQKGANYTLDVPKGWAAIIACVSVEVKREGKPAKSFLDTPFLVIQSPFKGEIGVYEGAVRIIPEEWLAALIDSVLPIQRLQTHKPNLQVTYYSD